MVGQEEIFDGISDIEKNVANLRELGVFLKNALYESPIFAVKYYSLFEISKIIELREIVNFYYLQDKISMMIDAVVQESSYLGESEEILKILEEMLEAVKEIIWHIEKETRENAVEF